ncbi:MAG: hypothetical protein JXA99_17205 [Candidatus Lokiarchaeota archaeon]|nr:hypothetical protein [Candidatus Lokiarchaeota archaeon]
MNNSKENWIKNFGDIITQQLGIKIKKDLLSNCESCGNLSNNEGISKCIKGIMDDFDKIVPEKEKRHKVMNTLGEKCFNNSFADKVEQIKNNTKSTEEIIKNLNKTLGAELFTLKNNKI